MFNKREHDTAPTAALRLSDSMPGTTTVRRPKDGNAHHEHPHEKWSKAAVWRRLRILNVKLGHGVPGAYGVVGFGLESEKGILVATSPASSFSASTTTRSPT